MSIRIALYINTLSFYFASAHLPTCVLGDPMQSIFGFGEDGLANWEEQVCKHFPLVAEMDVPWRWKNTANEELGVWLLDKRKALLAGKPINITNSPESVRWIRLNNHGDDYRKLVTAARCSHKSAGETSLIIGDSLSASSRYRIAKNVPGIITVEPVELKNLVDYARSLNLTNNCIVSRTLKFAESLITNIGTQNYACTS